jgi:hypothetical protein
MDNLADRQRIGGVSVVISDWCIWAEINYLDSPTDYREYLPQNCAAPRKIPDNGVVMLDSYAFRRSYRRHGSLWLVLLFVLIISWPLLRILDLW